MRVKSFLRKGLSIYWGNRYEKRLKAYRLDYPTWLKTMEKNEYTLKVTGESDLIMLSFGGGSFVQNAKQQVAEYLADHPNVLLVYGDEDMEIEKGVYDCPWFKPCWSPDTFLESDYLGEAVCVKRELYEKLTEEEKKDYVVCHRRLVELAGGFIRGCDSIAHIDGILFHRLNTWKNTGDHPEHQNLTWQEFPTENIFVSVVIPSKDNVAVLEKCIGTIFDMVSHIHYEIIVVDNGSCVSVKEQITEYTDKINRDLTSESKLHSIRYFYEPMDFNFSRLCNIGASNAKGNILLFLNDDIEAVELGWMERMAAKAVLPWVGAVGMKLWYPDSNRIQHAGITNIPIGPVHKLQFLNDNKCYYDDRNCGIRNVLAVTGACMMMRREVFQEAGGFSEEMSVAFNDVDLCFTLYEMGFHNVVINTTHLLHHESLSRGADNSEEKMKRLMREREILYQRHPDLVNKDPYYHKWLNQNALDTRIVPSYMEGKLFPDIKGFQSVKLEAGVKVDECLLLRIEYADTKRIQGYAVVLGSDNACFTKKLVFESRCGDKTFIVDVKEQYRPDIAENMPDQIHIALCGFQTEFTDTLPDGEYRIGVMAKDRISGMVLMNFSNRSICV